MKIFKKLFIILVSVLFLPIVFDFSSAAAGQSVTIGTGGITGVYYHVGGAICRFVNKNSSKHGISCAAESTGASVFNVNAIGTGDLDIGIVQSDIQNYAYNGREQFTANKDLRALF